MQPATQTVVRPECHFGEHSWCKLDEVRVGDTVVFPAKRCDCSCHRKAVQQ